MQGEPSDNAGAPKRLDWVDAMRGLAVIAVMLVHAGYGFPAMGRNLVKIASAGRYGVDLFFVISGFVLYHTYLRLPAISSRPRLVFLFRRWARLAPVYYLGAVFYCYVLFMPGIKNAGRIGGFLLNLLFLNGWTPAQASSVVPGGWSISAEAAYALFFVAVLPLLSNSRRALLMWTAVWIVTSQTGFAIRALVTGILGADAVSDGMDYLPWFHLPTFLAGVWCWHAWNRRETSGRSLHPGVRLLCFFFALFLLLTLSLGICPLANRALIAGVGCALAFYAWSAGPLPRMLVSPLAYIGRLSYGIYIIHFAVLDRAQTLVVGILPAATPSLTLCLGTLLLTMAMTLPLAWLSWNLIEKPVQQWAAKIGRRKEAISSAIAPTTH